MPKTKDEQALDKKYRELHEKHKELYPEQYKSAEEFHRSMHSEVQSSCVKKKKSDIDESKDMRNISNYRSKKHEITEVQKKRSIEYLNEVVNGVDSKESVQLKPIPVKEAKIKLWETIKHKLKGEKFDTSATVRIKNGSTEISYTELISNLLLYFIGNKESCFDLKKGICIFGNVGSGKTWIMEVFELFTNNAEFGEGYEKLKPFKLEKLKHITEDVRNSKDLGTLKKYIDGRFCYDDIGFESTEIRVYGETESVFSSLISTQYHRYQKSGKITHGTSNLLPSGQNSIESVYGERISSRCEMFNFVLLSGFDKRKK